MLEEMLLASSFEDGTTAAAFLCRASTAARRSLATIAADIVSNRIKFRWATRTLPGMAIIGAQAHRGPAPALLDRRARPLGYVAGCQGRSRSTQYARPPQIALG